MIHVVAAEKRTKEFPREAYGQPVGTLENYAQALQAVGEWMDDGKAANTICFYFHEEQGVSWIMVASLD